MFFSCGGSDLNQGEDYGNLLETPEGLVLTQSEHEIGWGNSQCLLCHNLENSHLVNRTGLSINMTAIREQTLKEGIASCATCHGTNGVP